MMVISRERIDILRRQLYRSNFNGRIEMSETEMVIAHAAQCDFLHFRDKALR